MAKMLKSRTVLSQNCLTGSLLTRVGPFFLQIVFRVFFSDPENDPETGLEKKMRPGPARVKSDSARKF